MKKITKKSKISKIGSDEIIIDSKQKILMKANH